MGWHLGVGRAWEAASSAEHLAGPSYKAPWGVCVSGAWGTVKWNMRSLHCARVQPYSGESSIWVVVVVGQQDSDFGAI